MSRKPRTKEWQAFIEHLSKCKRCAKVGRCETGAWLLAVAEKSTDLFKRVPAQVNDR